MREKQTAILLWIDNKQIAAIDALDNLISRSDEIRKAITFWLSKKPIRNRKQENKEMSK